MIRKLLAHNPRNRPSSKEIVSKYLPVKMEEADFANVSSIYYSTSVGPGLSYD